MPKPKTPPRLRPSTSEPLVPKGWTPAGYIDRIEQLIRECEPYRPDLAALWRERIEQIRKESK